MSSASSPIQKNYAIWVVTPPGYDHSACFYDQALPLRAAFSDLGMDVPIVTIPDPDRVNIVLGAHLLPQVPPTSADLILYNLEQIAPDVPWMTREYRELLSRYQVWDYSQQNIAELEKMRVRAKYLPVAYHPCMRSITPSITPSYDILHYGSMNERRAHVLQSLQTRDVRVKQLFGVYGIARDTEIARARLVLNVSYYDSKIFNITRCGALFSNSIPVVSEIGPGSEMFHKTGGFVEYNGLVGKCLEFLSAGAEDVGHRGFELYSKVNLADCLKEVL